MFRFTIRDVLWLTVVVALALGIFLARSHRPSRWEYKIDSNVDRSILQDAGDDGWELVAVAPLPNQGGLAFYFKRPK